MSITYIFAFSLVVYLDAYFLHKKGADLYFEHIKFKPVWLAVLTFLFSIITVPIYLIKRYKILNIIEKDNAASEEGLYLTREDTGLDATGIIILSTLGITIFAIVLEVASLIFTPLKTELWNLIIITIFSSFLTIFLIYKTVRRPVNIGFWKSLGLDHKGKSFFTLVLRPAFLSLTFATIASFLITTRKVSPNTPLSEILTTTPSAGALIMFILLAILAAPFLEEVIFRGYFFQVLQRLKGTTFAVVSISLFFGLSHVAQYWGDWLAISAVMLLGFILTMLRASSGSIIPSIVFHYVYNASSIIIPIIILTLSNPAYAQYISQYPMLDASTKETLLLESLTKEPERAEIYNDLAWLYAEENVQLDKALEFINQALTISSEESAFLDTKAEILYKLNRIDEAIAIEKNLIEKHPSVDFYREQLKKFKKAVKMENHE